MDNKPKVAVIGGTGKSGKYLVSRLIEQGFQFKILLRNPDNFKINSSLVEIVKGDVTNPDAVSTLIEGCQAVISMLGLGIPPSEPTIFSQATTNILQAMNEHRVHRYLVTTGLNVDTPSDIKGHETLLKTDWMRKNFPISTADKQSEFDILSASQVDWTMVRLPLIEQTDEDGEIITDLKDCPGDKIRAGDLANFVIKQMSTDEFVRKSPFIASI